MREMTVSASPDQIDAVMDGGRIVEDGTCDELIEEGGFFAELAARQRTD